MKHKTSRADGRSILAIALVAAAALTGSVGSANDDELLTVTSEATTKATTAMEAAREIQTKVVADTAREQTIEIIGEKRYAKNKAIVENRVIREAAKFIPFVQPGEPVAAGDGVWKMKVDLKVSVGSLRKIIIDTGLLTDADTPVTIVPMIAVTDRNRGVSQRWWLGDRGKVDAKDDSKKSVVDWANIIQLGMHKELMHQGFHLLLPVEGGVSNALPPVFRSERPTSQDLKQIGEYLGVSMALRGDVRVRELREASSIWQVQVRLEVLPVQGGRTVAEISRSFETDAGPADLAVKRKLEKETPEMAKDLAAQVFDAWTRGTLAATTVKLAVRGLGSPKQLGEFRSQLLRSIRDVKAVRERLFEPGRVIFEIDFASSPEEFRDRLKTADLPSFQEKVVVDSELGEADGTSVPFTLEVKPKAL